MTTPLVTHRGWWRQIRDDLAPYLPQLAAVAVGAAVAAGWTWAGWSLTVLALLGLALLAAVQEARIIAVRNRLDDHIDDEDQRRGPIAPAYEPEPPWMPAPPVELAPIEPFTGSGTHRPSPFPTEPKTEPIAVPQTPATVPTGVAVDAEWAQVMADADAYIAELRG